MNKQVDAGASRHLVEISRGDHTRHPPRTHDQEHPIRDCCEKVEKLKNPGIRHHKPVRAQLNADWWCTTLDLEQTNHALARHDWNIGDAQRFGFTQDILIVEALFIDCEQRRPWRHDFRNALAYGPANRHSLLGRHKHSLPYPSTRYATSCKSSSCSSSSVVFGVTSRYRLLSMKY